MLHRTRIFRPFAAAILAAIPFGLTLYAAKDALQPGIDPAAFQQPLPTDQRIVHALNRLSFGPAPEDVEQVRKMGLEQWLEQQLHPEKIAENPEVAARLTPLQTLRMSSAEAAAQYAPLKQRDPAAQQQRQAAVQEMLAQQAKQLPQDVLRQLKQKGKNGPGGNGGAQQALLAAMTPEARRDLIATRNPGQVMAYDLTESKLYRAIYSERQLQEVLTDFWFNHFNVDISKGQNRGLAASYERDAIRPHVLGNFRDLLQATAESPAMLFYLDNWQSASPERIAQETQARNGGRNAQRQLKQLNDRQQKQVKQLQQLKAKQQNRGLNENYARELLELHTLGVDKENQPGGYTQQDIIHVARAFTGWTLQQPRANLMLGGPAGGGQAGEFFFNDQIHDNREKVVLGVKIPAGGGKEDAEKVLDILARHPATAQFISLKLARRFVADDPPAALVDRMAKRFGETDGDIREVMRVMLQSPEFFSQGAWKAKVKTPLEMVVSAVRASGAEVNYAMPLANYIAELGQPLYRKQEPTGYSMLAGEWVNSAALLARMNFALDLAGGRVPGSKVELGTATGASQPEALLMETARRLLLAEPSAQTAGAVRKALAEKAATPALVAGLLLGSPEFQRR